MPTREGSGAWIREFRARYGLTLGDLGRYVRRLGDKRRPGWPMRCSGVTLERLESIPGYVTHPSIADLIADAVGATASQRDAIVAEGHRGTYRPRHVKMRRPEPAPSAVRAPEYQASIKAAIVKVDRGGEIVERYESVQMAADMNGIDESCVYKRCLRRIAREFHFMGVSTGTTFRYADEWEKMTPEERERDLERPEASGVAYVRGMKKAIVVIDREGNEIARYASAKDAAEALALCEPVIGNRCRHGIRRDEFKLLGISFRYAEEWDAMAEARRRERAM